jgi:nucleoside-diphosphate-sugar epimerase
MSGHAILIAGGYGVVGSRIAADLAPRYPDRIAIAGRTPGRPPPRPRRSGTALAAAPWT